MQAKWKVKTPRSFVKRVALTKVADHNTFILSAIIPADASSVHPPDIVINAFDGSGVTFYCCTVDINANVYMTRAKLLRQFHCELYLPFLFELFSSAPHPAKQITCPSPIGSKVTTHVSLTSSTCSPLLEQYTPIVRASRHENQLAICGKVAYNMLNSEQLVEWLEFQKILGVDMVLLFTLDVPENVQRIFDLYIKEGFLKTVPYQLAGNPVRSFKYENRSYPQFLHDEQLAIFDCRERLSGYSHVAAIDLDEIIIPKSNQTLKQLLRYSLDTQYPDAGAYYFYQQYHVTDWGPSHPNNTLYTLRYLHVAPPRWWAQKFVYIPKRTAYPRTHEVFMKQNFKTYIIPPEIAVIHHFRFCPFAQCHSIRKVVANDTLKYQTQLKTGFKNAMAKLNYMHS